jgi:transcriptional regulator with XRE-family HTH domain
MEQDTRAFDDHDDSNDPNGAGRGPDVPAEDKAMGRNARRIRQRRGLTLDVVAGLAGISKGHLSMLETGQRAWIRRGVVEDVAAALSCSVADLTEQSSIVPDQQSAIARAAIAALNVAYLDSTLQDAPDVPVRQLHTLVTAAHRANVTADNANLAEGADQLAALVTELHAHVARSAPDSRRVALEALVEACIAVGGFAWRLGASDLQLTAARRGYDAARELDRLDLAGLEASSWGHALTRVGARHGASTVFGQAIADMEAAPGPTTKDTRVTEARGMLHLFSAQLSARSDRRSDAVTHLEEARSLARFTGERNHMLYHFGPTNVAAWDLSISVESGAGPEAAEQFLAADLDLSVLDSKGRECAVQFDLARAWAQAEGPRDREAALALDRADRIAPLQIRNDPLAVDITRQLRRRARIKLWELDSLCNRLGVA